MYERVKAKVQSSLSNPTTAYVFGVGVGVGATILGIRAGGPMILAITPDQAKMMMETSAKAVVFKHRVVGTAIVKMVPEVV